MLFKMKTLGNEKLMPKSECKDRIKSKKRLKTQTVIPGRPEMTENDRKQILFFIPFDVFQTILEKPFTISR